MIVRPDTYMEANLYVPYPGADGVLQPADRRYGWSAGFAEHKDES